MLSLRSFRRDVSGATGTEYALVVALIALGAVGALVNLGGNMEVLYNEVALEGTVTGQSDLGADLGYGQNIATAADLNYLSSAMATDGDNAAATDVLSAEAALAQGNIMTAVADMTAANTSFAANQEAQTELGDANYTAAMAAYTASGNTNQLDLATADFYGVASQFSRYGDNETGGWGEETGAYLESSGLGQLVAGGTTGGSVSWSIGTAQLGLGNADMAALDAQYAAGGAAALGNNATLINDLTTANAAVLSGNPGGPFTYYQTAFDAQAAGGIYAADFANANNNAGGAASYYFLHGNR